VIIPITALRLDHENALQLVSSSNLAAGIHERIQHSSLILITWTSTCRKDIYILWIRMEARLQAEIHVRKYSTF